MKWSVVALAQRSDHIIGFPDESAKERTLRGALYPDDGHPKPERKGNAGIPEGLEGI
jgi:hypothetical protein